MLTFRKLTLVSVLLCSNVALLLCSCTTPAPKPPAAPLSMLQASTIEGESISLEALRGKVVVAANLSIGCATAPQLADLEKIYLEYKERGLVVLGFPSDDFAPPGHTTAPEKTQSVCRKRFGVTFPLFSPIHVKGSATHPIYSFLTTSGGADTTGEVSFNLEKFILDKQGRVRARYGPFTNVVGTEFREAIEKLLSE